MKIIFAVTLLVFELSHATGIITLASEGRRADNTSELNLNIYSLGFMNSTCTGAQISKEGHVLVAQHCVEPDIYGGQHQSEFTNAGVTFQDILQLDLRSWKYTFHPSVIANQLQIALGLDNQVVSASIVATGPGYTTPRFESQFPSEFRELHNQLTDEGYSDGGDFAVVLIPHLAGRSCLKLAERPVANGEIISNKAFPCFKRDGAWPQERTAEVAFNTIAGAESVEGFRVSKGNFLVFHGAESCNSGSPVLNSRGEIAGVLHTVLTDEVSMVLHIKRALDLMPATTRDRILELNRECRTL